MSKPSPTPDTVVTFSHPDTWDAAFGRSLLAMVMRDKGRRILDVIPSESSSHLVAGRNRQVELFLSTPAQWLLMLDADMTFSVDLIERLRRRATPSRIVGGLCFTAAELPVMFDDAGRRIESWTPGALVPVSATGGACLLVHRSVFERLPFPWFFMTREAHQMDQDQQFIRSARLAGIEVAVDTGTVLGHVKKRAVDGSGYVMPSPTSPVH
jgi:hypothetical protein